MNADWSGKLSPHTTHGLARGSLALSRFALDDKKVPATARRQVTGNAGANDSSTGDNDIRSLHIVPVGNGQTFLTNPSDDPT
jgi:hypothetical protein